jgi:hypothetical protein
VQRLQFFLSESRWDPEKVNERRLELLLADPATAPHGGGVLVIDDSGDRKDGTKTAHVGFPGASTAACPEGSAASCSAVSLAGTSVSIGCCREAR